MMTNFVWNKNITSDLGFLNAYSQEWVQEGNLDIPSEEAFMSTNDWALKRSHTS